MSFGLSSINQLASQASQGRESGLLRTAAELRPISLRRDGAPTSAISESTSKRPPLRDAVTISQDAKDLASKDDGAKDLSDDEKREVQELKRRDAEVKAHEQAHLSALGGEGGSANYEYTTGPDGRRYATGGEVPVSISAESGDPQATIAKAQRVARAAVAPAQPSAADLSARGKAVQLEREARAELREEQTEASSTDGASCVVCGAKHGGEVSHDSDEILRANQLQAIR